MAIGDWETGGVGKRAVSGLGAWRTAPQVEMAKVMLVEDDYTMRSLMRSLLQFEGFEVVGLDGRGDQQALVEAMRSEAPDLVILDVHLGQADGFDLLRRVRQVQGLDSLRVLMSSGMDLRERCAAEGADGFIMKPYMPDELVGKIRKMLGEERGGA